jgi:hypothetical protein
MLLFTFVLLALSFVFTNMGMLQCLISVIVSHICFVLNLPFDSSVFFPSKGQLCGSYSFRIVFSRT